MRLDANDLLLFFHVIELGGVSAAARRLNLAKSSVSRAVASLEEQMGTRLLNRSTRQLSLTEAGGVVFERASVIAAEIEAAKTAVENLLGQPRGNLSVTAPYAIVRHILAPRLSRFLAEHSDLTVSIDPTIRIVDMIDEGVDVAIRTGPMADSSLIARKLADVRLILVAAADWQGPLPDDPAALAALPLIDLTNRLPRRSWRLHGSGGEIDVEVNPRLAFGEPSIVLDMVLQGVGIGIVPEIYARSELATGRLRQVLPQWHLGLRPIHAVYPSRRLMSPKLSAFLHFLQDCFDMGLRLPADQGADK